MQNAKKTQPSSSPQKSATTRSRVPPATAEVLRRVAGRLAFNEQPQVPAASSGRSGPKGHSSRQPNPRKLVLGHSQNDGRKFVAPDTRSNKSLIVNGSPSHLIKKNGVLVGQIHRMSPKTYASTVNQYKQAPVATGHEVVVRPTITTSRFEGGRERTVIYGTEFMQVEKVTQYNNVEGGRLAMVPISPKFFTSTRAHYLAGMYQEWKLKHCRFRYVTSCPTDQPGMIVMYYQSDPSAPVTAAGEDLIRHAFVHPGTVSGSVWMDHVCVIDPDTSLLKKLYTAEGDSAAEQVAGIFHLLLGVAIGTVATEYTIGQLIVEYEFEYSNPTIDLKFPSPVTLEVQWAINATMAQYKPFIGSTSGITDAFTITSTGPFPIPADVHLFYGYVSRRDTALNIGVTTPTNDDIFSIQTGLGAFMVRYYVATNGASTKRDVFIIFTNLADATNFATPGTALNLDDALANKGQWLSNYDGAVNGSFYLHLYAYNSVA